MTNYQEGFHPYGGYGKRPTSEGDGSGGVGGGDGASTQTLTVTKDKESDAVSVQTLGWADYIAENYSAAVEVQPDSTEGLVSVYSIPVGVSLNVTSNNGQASIYVDAEMTKEIPGSIMPSTPIYTRSA